MVSSNRVTNDFSDLSTNINPEALSYHSVVNKPSASCQEYLQANSRAPTSLDKNKMKVLAQMMPTYNYNTETGGTEIKEACTLPKYTLRTYNINDMIGDYQCILQDERNTPLKLSSAKGAKDVVKGCVMKFSPDNETYIDGDTFNTSEKIDEYLDNAYNVLDYETRLYIQSLREKIKQLTEKKRVLEQVELPKSHSEKLNAMYSYNLAKIDCDHYISNYNHIMNQFGMLVYAINRAIAMINRQADALKSMLKQYHREHKLVKIVRNISELSYVTIYWHQYRRGRHASFAKPITNLSINNINRRDEYANGLHEIAYVGESANDEARSVFFPPGMNCIMYEHANFQGIMVTFEIPGWPNNNHPAEEPNFGEVLTPHGHALHGRGYTTNFNDKMSSIKLKGAFKSAYINDEVEFARRVDNAFSGENVGSGVVLYQHCNYEGHAVIKGAGSYNIREMGIANDSISSIKVSPGYNITVYEHSNFNGHSKSFGSDVSCLVDIPMGNGRNWNDKISSFIVRRT